MDGGEREEIGDKVTEKWQSRADHEGPYRPLAFFLNEIKSKWRVMSRE
jgi:hypothetical protein